MVFLLLSQTFFPDPFLSFELDKLLWLWDRVFWLLKALFCLELVGSLIVLQRSEQAISFAFGSQEDSFLDVHREGVIQIALGVDVSFIIDALPHNTLPHSPGNRDWIEVVES